MFREKALDGFRFAIGPENINRPASSGIFPRQESWSLLEHSSNMRLWRPASRQLSCRNQTDRLAKADRRQGSGLLSLPVVPGRRLR